MRRTDVETGSGIRRTRTRFVLPVLLGFIGATVATAAIADVRSDIDSILSGRSYQKELPQTPVPPEQPSERIELPDVPDDYGGIPDRSPSSAGPVLESLLWVLAIAGGILLLLYIFGVIKRIPRRAKVPQAKKAQKKPTDPDAPIDAEPTPFDEIERLAREGAFAEAVHLLLLHCFDDLRRRSPYGRDPALTSREILAGAPLSEDVRSSLAFIVSAVEVGHFGGQPINKPVYERCVESYRTITAASAL